jgi:uncharacterized coiled-coil protein SlyX
VELEQRIARLELRLKRTCDELDLTRQRMASLQAQLDHLIARLGERV